MSNNMNKLIILTIAGYLTAFTGITWASQDYQTTYCPNIVRDCTITPQSNQWNIDCSMFAIQGVTTVSVNPSSTLPFDPSTATFVGASEAGDGFICTYGMGSDQSQQFIVVVATQAGYHPIFNNSRWPNDECSYTNPQQCTVQIAPE